MSQLSKFRRNLLVAAVLLGGAPLAMAEDRTVACDDCRSYEQAALNAVAVSGDVYVVDEFRAVLKRFTVTTEPGYSFKEAMEILPEVARQEAFGLYLSEKNYIQSELDKLTVPETIADSAWDCVGDGGATANRIIEWINVNRSLADRMVNVTNAGQQVHNGQKGVMFKVALKDGGFLWLEAVAVGWDGDQFSVAMKPVFAISVDGDKHNISSNLNTPEASSYTFNNPRALDSFVAAARRAGVPIQLANPSSGGGIPTDCKLKNGRWECVIRPK